MKEISYWDLQQWKQNSLDTALRCDFDSELIERMRSRDVVMLGLDDEIPSLGRCCYDPQSIFGLPDAEEREKVLILMNPENIVVKGIKDIRKATKEKKIPLLVREFLLSSYLLTGKKGSEIAMQTVMDHEIGHGYHYLAGLESGEEAACRMQLYLARERGKNDWTWWLTSKCIPLAVRYWKKVEIK